MWNLNIGKKNKMKHIFWPNRLINDRNQHWIGFNNQLNNVKFIDKLLSGN